MQLDIERYRHHLDRYDLGEADKVRFMEQMWRIAESALIAPGAMRPSRFCWGYPDREGQDLGVAIVSYRHPVDQGLTGLLTPGDVVPLADGLLVNVNATYAS